MGGVVVADWAAWLLGRLVAKPAELGYVGTQTIRQRVNSSTQNLATGETRQPRPRPGNPPSLLHHLPFRRLLFLNIRGEVERQDDLAEAHEVALDE